MCVWGGVRVGGQGHMHSTRGGTCTVSRLSGAHVTPYSFPAHSTSSVTPHFPRSTQLLQVDEQAGEEAAAEQQARRCSGGGGSSGGGANWC